MRQKRGARGGEASLRPRSRRFVRGLVEIGAFEAVISAARLIHIAGVPVGVRLDDDEFINAQFVELAEAERMIERGEINDAKTVAAIYKYLYSKKA